MMEKQGLGDNHHYWDVVAVWEPVPRLAMVFGLAITSLTSAPEKMWREGQIPVFHFRVPMPWSL